MGIFAVKANLMLISQEWKSGVIIREVDLWIFRICDIVIF